MTKKKKFKIKKKHLKQVGWLILSFIVIFSMVFWSLSFAFMG
ncbi:MAG TPA: hypothetical protein VKO42_02050 [Patescibacteria group bacterium]|nr:hypothetical protein [Patescibacteria group bacterium]